MISTVLPCGGLFCFEDVYDVSCEQVKLLMIQTGDLSFLWIGLSCAFCLFAFKHLYFCLSFFFFNNFLSLYMPRPHSKIWMKTWRCLCTEAHSYILPTGSASSGEYVHTYGVRLNMAWFIFGQILTASERKENLCIPLYEIGGIHKYSKGPMYLYFSLLLLRTKQSHNITMYIRP